VQPVPYRDDDSVEHEEAEGSGQWSGEVVPSRGGVEDEVVDRAFDVIDEVQP
jgi:hypothetical protein